MQSRFTMSRSMIVVLAFFSCGGGVCGSTAPRAAMPRYDDSLADAKCDKAMDAQPLLVDTQPADRADIEVAMHEGIAVVAWDCKTLRLLKSCKVEGSYGFVGTSTKQQVVAITNMMELRANVASVSKRFEAEVERGSKLDVALAMVGKTMSTRRRAAKEDLIGDCMDATHIVTGATVGAFAMEAATKNRTGGAVEIFSIGAGANAVQHQRIGNRDGDLAACNTAKPDDKRAPAQCNALLRLDLSPLAGAPPSAALAAACPAPLVWNGTACLKKESLEKHVCRLGDATDCDAQCKAKEPRSCTTLGVMELEGKGIEKNEQHAFMHFYEACSLADATACSNLGIMTEDGIATNADPGKAAKLFTDACKDGEPAACANLGELYGKGLGVPQDDRRAAAYYERSCSGGNPAGCSQLGAVLAKGKGIAPDKKLAARFLEKSCDGDWARGCTNAAALAIEANDRERGVKLYRKGCSGGDQVACEQLKKYAP